MVWYGLVWSGLVLLSLALAPAAHLQMPELKSSEKAGFSERPQNALGSLHAFNQPFPLRGPRKSRCSTIDNQCYGTETDHQNIRFQRFLSIISDSHFQATTYNHVSKLRHAASWGEVGERCAGHRPRATHISIRSGSLPREALLSVKPHAS